MTVAINDSDFSIEVSHVPYVSLAPDSQLTTSIEELMEPLLAELPIVKVLPF